MKKLIIPVLVLISMLALASPAMACDDCQRTFWTTGYTTADEVEFLPDGTIKFKIIAQGGKNDGEYDDLCHGYAEQYAAQICPVDPDHPVCDPIPESCEDACVAITGLPCGVSGDITGSFRFRERGKATIDPDTGAYSGANIGRLVVGTDDGRIRYSFAGKTDGVSVWGRFKVLDGTGRYENLEGAGRYRGMAGYIFTVKYTGRYCGPK